MPHNRIFPGRFVAPFYLGSMFNPVNSTLIATALVAIATYLHIPPAEATILVSVFYLSSAIGQPASGKLAEQVGPRKMFIGGIVVALIGGVIGGFGTHLPMLIISRALIGLGASTAYPASMLLIRRRADSAGLSEPPSTVLGWLQISATVSSVVGLPLGGVLVGYLGWRTAFFINVPFTIIAFIIAYMWLPHDSPSQAKKSLKELYSSIDATGMLGFAGMMVSILLLLFDLPRFDWIALLLALLFGTFFILWELRDKRPFIDVRLLAKNIPLSKTYIRLAALTLCTYTILYGLTEWLEVAKDLDSSLSGLLILPMSLVSACVAWFVSRKNRVRAPLIISATVSIGASVLVLFLSSGSPVLFVILITLLFGVTMGTVMIGNQTALYMLTTPEDMGTASGLLRTAAYIGSIASSALINLVFQTSVSDGGLHILGIIMIAVSILALLLTVTDKWIIKGL